MTAAERQLAYEHGVLRRERRNPQVLSALAPPFTSITADIPPTV